MLLEAKIAALVFAGVMSCQSVAALSAPPVPAETAAAETVAVETVAVETLETQAPTEPAVALEPLELYQEWLPLSCTSIFAHEDMGLVQIDKVPGHENFPHTFVAYLPPYYDPYETYDLLIFLGPYDGKQGDCVDKYQSTWYTEIFRFRTVFDHLIHGKKVKPFIMIQPDYLEWKDLELTHEAIAKNIKEELLPYLAENYAIYAEDGSYESLVAARDHVAMGGCSMGGMFTLGGLMPYCADVASSFCPMSCNFNMSGVQQQVESMLDQYPLNKLVYVAGGIEEKKMQTTGEHLKAALEDVLTDENYFYLEMKGTHHHYSTWAAGLWDAIQIMFREDIPLADMVTFTPRETDEAYMAGHPERERREEEKKREAEKKRKEEELKKQQQQQATETP